MNNRTRLLAAVLPLACSTSALAQSRVVATANVATQAGAQSVTLGGQTFVNQGLLGAGRLGANTLDFRGETLGSFSGMAIDLSKWRRNADGSYAGSIFTLPDRGPFDGAIDYRNRVHTSDIAFRPLPAGSPALPQATTSQSQLTITPTSGFTLKDANGIETTGRDPGANTITRGGIIYPSATDGTAAGRISIDAEAIAFRPDGSFYLSDEYSAGLYYFDATGRQIGAIQTVPALLPRTGGAINFNSVAPGQTGRRNNQGLEAMALTPDNRKLATILQSATVQDTNGANQQTRNNTRILIYDISATATPTNPIGHYVLQLPTLNNNGAGGAADRTAAQSEMLALNDTQFLVLARDSIGRGVAANASASTTPVFKSILLVDVSGATNLVGSTYESGVTPVATNGALVPGITPVQQVELVNLLNPVQLGRVGMNITRLPLSTPTTLSEKIEAMALAPVLEEGAAQDFFLFVGNDNDFQGTNICFNGVCSASGALDGTGNNESVLLVYRLTLPTYVDPLALAAMTASAPIVLGSVRTIAADLAAVATSPAMERLGSMRRLSDDEGYGEGVQLWGQDKWQRINTVTSRGVSVSRAQGLAAAGGIDVGFGPARIGIAAGYEKVEANGGPLAIESRSTSIAAYAGVSLPVGIYYQGAVAKSVQLDLDKLNRAGAYGLTGRGRTAGDVWTATGELGWMSNLGPARAGPFGSVEYIDVDVDGYTEAGASLGNVVYQDLDYRRLSVTAGLEARTRLSEAVVPSLRVGYTWEDGRGDRDAVVRLASAQHSLATQTVALPSTERGHVVASVGVQGSRGRLGYRFSGDGRFARGADDARVSIGLSLEL